MGEQVYIVIPAYNEQKTIGKVITSLRKAGYRNIIVVDDGSKDRTKDIVLKHKVILLTHIINRGQGAALKTGIDHALRCKADIIVTFDADGQFLVSEIKQVIRPIKEKTADVVLGSRFLGMAKNIPLLKKLVLFVGRYVVFFIYGIKVTDSQIGFRAFNRRAAELIQIESSRMEHAGEIMGEIVNNKLRYVEIPVTVLYTKYAKKRGQSWDRSFHLGLRMLYRKFMR